MLLSYCLILISIILLISGFIGCIIPIIPGPFMNYSAILILQYFSDDHPFSTKFIIYLGIINIIVIILDYIIPILGVKLYGATKYGIWGSIIGMTIGIFFIPPIGMMLGVLIGAIIGELLAGKKYSKALKTGIVSFLSTIFVIIIKLSLCGLTTFYFFQKIRYLVE